MTLFTLVLFQNKSEITDSNFKWSEMVCNRLKYAFALCKTQ